MATSAADGPRFAPVRRRVHVARLTLAGGAAVLFGVTSVLARVHFAGHHKQGVTSLTPPPQLLEVVRRNQLEAGVLAPAEAAPGIASAPS
jgi:hypothetical protein